MKVPYFLWLTTHRGMLSGSWLQQMGWLSLRMRSQLAKECSEHCLWNCHIAKVVWCRVLRWFSYIAFEPFAPTWGAALSSTESSSYNLYRLRQEIMLSSCNIVSNMVLRSLHHGASRYVLLAILAQDPISSSRACLAWKISSITLSWM